MKLMPLMVILLILIIPASAEIQVLNNVQEIYNVNDNIPLKTSISYKEEISGYIRVNIECDNKFLEHYTTPFEFKQNPQEIEIPGLILTENMIGKCTLNIVTQESWYKI